MNHYIKNIEENRKKLDTEKGVYSKMPTLCRDILYVVAEKMLMIEKKGNVINMAKASDFMFIDEKCKSSYLAQFSKFKALDYSIHADAITIFLYERRKFDRFTNKGDHNRQFRVDLAFLRLLIAHRRFAPERIQSCDVCETPSWTQKQSAADCGPIQPINPFRALLTLLDLEGMDLPEVPLTVGKMEIYEHGDMLHFFGLFTFLSLNAIVCEINSNLQDYGCCVVPLDISISSDRTKDICMSFNFSWNILTDDCESFHNFPADKWTNMLLFIFRSCSELRRFTINIDLPDNYDICVNLLVEHISKIINAFVYRILPAVFGTVHPPEDFHMFVQFRAYLSRYVELSTVPLRNCQLLSSMGNSMTDSDVSITRCAYFDHQTMSLSANRCPTGASEKINAKEDHLNDDEEDSFRYEDKGPGCWVGYSIFHSTDESYDELHDNMYDFDYDIDNDSLDNDYSIAELEDMNEEYLFYDY